MVRKLLVLGLLLVGFATQNANASVVFTLNEVGADVVLSGSGTLDLTGTSFFASGSLGGNVKPNDYFVTGGTAIGDLYFYSVSVSGPSNFGPGTTQINASSGTGDTFGFQFGSFNAIGVPVGYAGGPLSGTATFAGETITSLGAATGTYIWTIGNGDTITLKVGPSSAVPEPSTLLLLAIGGVGIVMARRRK